MCAGASAATGGRRATNTLVALVASVSSADPSLRLQLALRNDPSCSRRGLVPCRAVPRGCRCRSVA